MLTVMHHWQAKPLIVLLPLAFLFMGSAPLCQSTQKQCAEAHICNAIDLQDDPFRSGAKNLLSTASSQVRDAHYKLKQSGELSQWVLNVEEFTLLLQNQLRRLARSRTLAETYRSTKELADVEAQAEREGRSMDDIATERLAQAAREGRVNLPTASDLNEILANRAFWGNSKELVSLLCTTDRVSEISGLSEGEVKLLQQQKIFNSSDTRIFSGAENEKLILDRNPEVASQVQEMLRGQRYLLAWGNGVNLQVIIFPRDGDMVNIRYRQGVGTTLRFFTSDLARAEAAKALLPGVGPGPWYSKNFDGPDFSSVAALAAKL